MHKIVCVLIFIACFWILTVDSQGGGGGHSKGSSSGSSSSGHSYTRHSYNSHSGNRHRGGSSSGSGCRTDECRQRENLILFGFVGIFVAFAIIILLWKCCTDCTDNASTNKKTFVRPTPRENPEECKQQETPMLLMNGDHCNIFRDGMWSSRYCQYGKWHGPFEFTLSFDHQTMQVKGWGWDDVGKFTICGSYSKINFQMGLTKTYVRGTGDADENLGHSVTIQLTGNTRNGIFEGRWYVHTSEFQGDDEFELKFARDCAYHEEV